MKNGDRLLGLIFFSIALSSTSGAFACTVGTTVMRANFIKLTQCVHNLEGQVKALQAAMAQMNSAKGLVSIKAIEDDVPHKSVDEGWGGMAGTISLGDSRAVCPPGSWVSGIQGFKLNTGVNGITGSAEPMSSLRFTCRGLQ